MFKNKLISVVKKILNYIYPNKCLACGKVIDDNCICERCFLNIDYNTVHPVKLFKGARIYSAGIYQNSMQSLIREIKYRKRQAVAKPLGRFLNNYWQQLEESKFNDYEVIPVPLHKNRKNERGFNQAEAIAKEFGEFNGFSINTKLVERIKNTKPLYHIKFLERKKVLKDAFKVNKEHYNGKKLLIIDDIVTTGATFSEIIKELKTAGIEAITCISVSKRERA